jgi:hypothetical protein
MIATVPLGFEVVPGKDPNGWSFTWRLAPRRSELFLIATVLLFFNIHSRGSATTPKKGLQQGILGAVGVLHSAAAVGRSTKKSALHSRRSSTRTRRDSAGRQ